MTLGRRQAIWLLIGCVVACSWCSMLSGVGGWLAGHDLGRRETRAALLPDTGVLVIRVERGSPADRSGIRRNAMIIAVNGAAVEDVPGLRDQLGRRRPGDEIELTYRYDLGENVVKVQLGSFPNDINRPYLGIYYTARAEDPADL